MHRTETISTPWGAAPPGAADQVLARVFGASLDRRLAAGHAPESDRLLAARARHIVSLPRRRALARNWEHLLAVAGRGPAPAVPLCHDRIAAAEPAIRDLIRCLRAALPVPAQGVAAARMLLTDATGPVYSRRSQAALDDVLRAALEQLDPARPLLSAVT
ncbi:MAG TPA: hypothetical protein VMH35_08045 [Streptosporangiaceae bacterium]|nr:hypothetical protein [Streptosporangiaceae bacterium]